MKKGTEGYIAKIKGMYNACAKNFNQFLQDYDMDTYNKRSDEIMKTYQCSEDISALLWWFAPKVQTIFDEWRKQNGDHT